MIDLVHDIAESYRKVVNANSYPGKILSLSKYIINNELEVPFYESTLLLMYMLLDGEVTFKVFGEDSSKTNDLISKLTYAKTSNVAKADFIFLLSSSTDEEKKIALKKAKNGTLVDPHTSATLICEIESLTSGEILLIKGPGILNTKKIKLDFFKDWYKIRNSRSIEFPLGIDMIFVDKSNELMAIPRTTQLKGGE